MIMMKIINRLGNWQKFKPSLAKGKEKMMMKMIRLEGGKEEKVKVQLMILFVKNAEFSWKCINRIMVMVTLVIDERATQVFLPFLSFSALLFQLLVDWIFLEITRIYLIIATQGTEMGTTSKTIKMKMSKALKCTKSKWGGKDGKVNQKMVWLMHHDDHHFCV